MAVVHTPDDSLGSAALAVALAATVILAFVVLYLVGFDQGAISRTACSCTN